MPLQNSVNSCCFCSSEETDKVYFRKKDEVSEYAEFMFRSKDILSKK